MAVHALTLKSLMEDLDGGRVHEAFMAELRRIVSDCEDRPNDGKPRDVVLKFQIVPVADEDGQLDSVNGKFQVASSVPRRRSKVYSFMARKGGVLAFNDLSEDDAKQPTLDRYEKGNG